MGRADRAHLHVAGGPDHLRLVLCFECNEMDQIGGPACEPAFVLGQALGDFAGMDVGVGEMRHEFLAADGKSEN